MANNHFVYNPSTVDIRRSKFKDDSFWKGSIYHGDLVPLEVKEILPGDSFIYDLSVFIRTATPPIVPFTDSVRFNVAAFYVPKRLIFSKAKEFYGENTEGYGIQSEVLEPRTTWNGFVQKNQVATYPRSFATYFGLVAQDTGTITNKAPISLLPFRAYLQVYNDWFRNENFMAPYLWDHTATGDASRDIATIGGVGVNAMGNVPVVCKQLDRFTSCLPWAQKGTPVSLGLEGYAPIVSGKDLGLTGDGVHDITNPYIGVKGDGNLTPYGLYDLYSSNKLTDPDYGIRTSFNTISSTSMAANETNLFTDLSLATAATINEFRLAFATQRYLEALARSGSKYREYIKGIFGVSIGDTTAQMAEYLGGFTIDLNIDQVLQTTGFAAGGTTTLGAPGAVSTSAANNHLFVKSFTEPGFLVIVGYAKHNRTYGQGIDEIWQKHELWDYYNPKFANIGETAIKSNLIYFDGNNAVDDVRFGFQEAWSEYRSSKDRVIGLLAPSNALSYNFWTLSENFATQPTLNASFLQEDRTNITRALAGGASSPDYFLDIKFRRTVVRPMPLYSIPGLIDHH